MCSDNSIHGSSISHEGISLHSDLIFSNYLNYLKCFRAGDEAYLKYQRLYLKRFFDRINICSVNIVDITPQEIQKFCFHYSKQYGIGSCKHMFTVLKSFLEYCRLQNILDNDRPIFVPCLKRRRLSDVPKGLEQAQIIELLDTIDRGGALGKRDYAIILILAVYGVRSINIRKLKLSDILWEKDQIVFCAAKRGKTITQYLTPEVGNTLFDYICNARANDVSQKEVFLTDEKRPFKHSGSISGIIKRRLDKAGINLPVKTSRGAHAFRHAFATNMLNRGESLKNISDMLGHLDIDSVCVYAKVDFNTLKKAVIEWPEATL